MRFLAAGGLCVGLLVSPMAEAGAAPRGSAKSAADALTDADLARFLQLLKENYVHAEKLTETELSRATVGGLLERLGPGAAILDPGSSAQTASSPFRAELIEGRAGYLRLGSLTPANVAELDTALQSHITGGAQAMIVDLRATPPGSEFEEAAAVCRRFCPKGRLLFTMKKPGARQELLLTSKDEPRWRGLLAVLVDADTAGAAEVVAAVLRIHARALVFGQRTRGEAAEFAELPLPSGKLLRVAIGEVTLPESGGLFPHGVKPDVEVDVPQQTTDDVLALAVEKGSVAELVSETERPRLNEAALVAGVNPEVEAIQAAQRARQEKSKAPLRDAVLQRALDFIATIGIYEKKAGPR